MKPETCHDCLRPCPEHSQTFCGTCHKHPHQCDMGSCTTDTRQRGSVTFERTRERDGSVIERRRFCRKHSTHPHFGWLRSGMTPVGK